MSLERIDFRALRQSLGRHRTASSPVMLEARTSLHQQGCETVKPCSRLKMLLSRPHVVDERDPQALGVS